ncbi:MAG: efflux RND transporter periplasmic adaptor subunit [Ignavibacteriaceae bacterium]
MNKSKYKMVQLFFVAVFISLINSGCSEEQADAPTVVRPVKTVTVSGFGEGEITFPATIEAGEKLLMTFRVSGRIIELPVREGQEIRKGQLIARLDPNDYQLAVNEARANFNKAVADLNRYQVLYEKDAVPLADLDLRIAQRDVTKAQLDETEKNLTYTYLRAPFTGRIGNRYVENYMDVKSNEQIVDLNDITSIEVKVDVPESIISLSRTLGDKLELKNFAEFETAPGKQYQLQIKEVSNRADPLTQTFQVTFKMPQPDDIALLPGMNALVRLEATIKSDVDIELRIRIPAIAVMGADDEGSYVWVVNQQDMTVHRKMVELGQMSSEDKIFISSGLIGGEQLVVAGMKSLQEGIKVQLWKPEY